MGKRLQRVMWMAMALAIMTIPVGAANYYTVGNKGSDVLTIQKQLKKLGYNVKTDGVYTNDTAKAVSKFQKDKKVQVSGNVGGWTYYLLTGKRDMLASSTDKAVAKKSKKDKKNKNGKKTETTEKVKYTKLKDLTKADPIGSKLVASAYDYIGVPYVFGGNTPDGFDCSGFTRYVFSHNGISLPRMADEQYRLGHKVARNELRPGDLVFFTTYEPGVSHAGIYVGDNNFISATSSGGIRVDSLNGGYWGERYIGAKRVR